MHGVEGKNFLFVLNGTHVCNESMLHIVAKLHRFKESHLFALNRIHIVAGLTYLPILQSLIPQSSRDGGGAAVAHLLQLWQAVVRLSSSVLMYSPSSNSSSE
jgi:hypothetical protein